MNKNVVIGIIVAVLVLVGGGVYAVQRHSKNVQADMKASEAAAMKKTEEAAAMKKQKEADAMKKDDDTAAMKKEGETATGDVMTKTDITTP